MIRNLTMDLHLLISGLNPRRVQFCAALDHLHSLKRINQTEKNSWNKAISMYFSNLFDDKRIQHDVVSSCFANHHPIYLFHQWHMWRNSSALQLRSAKFFTMIKSRRNEKNERCSKLISLFRVLLIRKKGHSNSSLHFRSFLSFQVMYPERLFSFSHLIKSRIISRIITIQERERWTDTRQWNLLFIVISRSYLNSYGCSHPWK